MLRTNAASILRLHRDDFLPFLTNDDGEMLDEQEFDKYCQDVESTSAWGSMIEVRGILAFLFSVISPVELKYLEHRSKPSVKL
jgi:OTU domain-containing protein 6